ncbi:hypothetical protein HN51_051987 [Arachis hypogaea]
MHGSLYKVLMVNGMFLAVKRIKDWGISESDFQRTIGKVSQVNHPFVLQPLAYDCSRQEKLLAYEYMDNGGLFNMLYKALWYKILELRFLLQKQFSSSNRLPQDPVKSSFCEADENVRVAYSDLITSSKETLDSILELQEDITNQVAAYMRDPSRMIKQMRLRKSTVSVFESVAMEDLETLYAEANAYALASHIFWALWALIQIQLLNINLHHVMMIVNEIMTLNVEFE